MNRMTKWTFWLENKKLFLNSSTMKNKMSLKRLM